MIPDMQSHAPTIPAMHVRMSVRYRMDEFEIKATHPDMEERV